MTRRVATAGALAIATTAGALAAASAEDAPPAQRVRTATQPKLFCSRVPFPPSALKRPATFERSSDPKAQALRAFLESSADEVGQDPTGWRLLAANERWFEVVGRRYEGEYGHMLFERRGGRWSWYNSGGCSPVAYHGGRGATPWRLRQPEAPIARNVTRIPIWVEPDFCNSGRDASGLVLRPLAHYGRKTVTVTYFVREPKGDRTCQGSPPTRVTLILDEPLNGRRLRDGGPYPPRFRT